LTTIKSFSVGKGDMFYINHNSDNFTVIDCNLGENKKEIMKEVTELSRKKRIDRFISTHPDDDHFHGIEYFDEQKSIVNFYVVKNEAKKEETTDSFNKYCELRDSDKAFFMEKDCKRRWLNDSDDERDSSGISILWPDINNSHYKKILAKIKEGKSSNNTSAIIKYSLENGVTALWMGDLEKEFMEKIEDEVDWPEIDILLLLIMEERVGRYLVP